MAAGIYLSKQKGNGLSNTRAAPSPIKDFQAEEPEFSSPPSQPEAVTWFPEPWHRTKGEHRIAVYSWLDPSV